MQQSLNVPTNLQQAQALFNTMPQMIAVIDASLRYRLINQRHGEYFGHSEQALLGHYAGEVLGQTYARMIDRYFAQALKGKHTTWIINHQSEDLGERLLSVKLLPYPSQGGDIRNILFVAEDITDTVHLHDSLTAIHESGADKILRSREELDQTLRSSGFDALSPDSKPDNKVIPFQQAIKRRVLATRMIDQLSQMQHDGGHKAFLIFTIKNYAAIIEQHGEAAGRAVLSHFAGTLDTLLADSIQISQCERERIAIAIPGISLETAVRFGRILCREMKRCHIQHQGEAIHYSVYSGATGFRPDDADIKQAEALDTDNAKVLPN